ncbi:aldose 1-epimerase family protein [Catenulispora pinisilvae]|uniref:aldose 1-epimerase family protein n=1 Tax=Catenulispora pinisilvae TaxID=2705253 RepID=UPI0018920D3E|nr:aldose 1-epimerase family protein [Catenulispora pinisilvae]
MPDFLTGEQHVITAGPYRAVITEAGAGLRELTHDGEPLVLTYAADEPAPAAFGQLLIPWPNRVARGRYRFDGRDHQLDLSEPELDNAIHGLTRWSPWSLVEQSPDAVRLAYALPGSTGYPFRLDLQAEYRLDAAAGLTVTLTATNPGTRALPYAHGMHPYITVGEPLDTCTIQLPGTQYQPVDDRMIPTGGPKDVAGSEYDLRAGRVLGYQKIDIAFTGLDRGADGLARVRLTGSRRSTSFWSDRAQPWLEIYTADNVPAESRRRGLGCEPMTGPPNALASGVDLIRLEPGAQYRGSWGIAAG